MWVFGPTNLLSSQEQQGPQSFELGLYTLGSDIAPAHARGRFFGASRLVANSGSMSNPISFALLSQFAGFTAAFAFRSVIGFAAALVFVFFVKETLKKE